MLIQSKGWVAQEHYEQYLKIKENMIQLSRQVQYYRTVNINEELAAVREEELYKLAKELMFHIEQLKFKGITAEQLLLLS